MRTRRLLGAAALTTLVVVGLTGCMKVDMQLQLQEDDTIDGTMIYGISRDLAEAMGQDPEALAEEMQGEVIPEDVGGGEYTQQPYDDGDYIGTEVTFTGAPLEGFSGDMADPDSLNIVREGDEYVVSGAMDMTDTSGMEGLPDMTSSFDVRVSITFPGDVSEHNGELDGNTVTWTPTIGERNEISARGSAIDNGKGGGGGGSDLPIALIAGIAAAALLLIGLVLFFVLRGRKKTPPAVVGGYPAEGYAGYTPQEGTYMPAAPPVQGYAPEAGYSPPADPTQGYAPPADPAQGYAPPEQPPTQGYAPPAPPEQPPVV